jgi:hypothetical protein
MLRRPVVLKERLDLLKRLNFKSDLVNAAIETVDAALHSKKQQQKWAKVVVFHGYPIDKPDMPVGRFPASAAAAVGKRIKEVLDGWKIGKGDLAICGGSTEGDVMFGENCLEREVHVRLLVLEPTPLQLAQVFSDPASSEWAIRSSSLVDHPATEVWYHRAELGDPGRDRVRPRPPQSMDFEYRPHGSRKRDRGNAFIRFDPIRW